MAMLKNQMVINVLILLSFSHVPTILGSAPRDPPSRPERGTKPPGEEELLGKDQADHS
jgi:hypothetical protein